ncbi:hypothetical protein TrVE_jg8156 [Triparma verrucosa]|uniref:Uncharacterized protein n=1 Tax=Triparma verrucosa TaxID=1606542 RepID=A0A9W7C1K3_9STRA|nr:hypothetical protein TrVE_jg8156 [Triparma verrucosa]
MADGPAVLPEDSHSDCINEDDRFGMFDLILGIPQLDWSWYRRWARDYAGMSLRGVVWTAPMGVGMRGWGDNDNTFSQMIGALMGLAYQCGHYWVDWTEPDFSKGSPAAEFIWGAVMSVAFMAYVYVQGGGKGGGLVEWLWRGTKLLITANCWFVLILILVLNYYRLVIDFECSN